MSERNGPAVRAVHRIFPVGHFAISVLFIVSALGLMSAPTRVRRFLSRFMVALVVVLVVALSIETLAKPAA